MIERLQPLVDSGIKGLVVDLIPYNDIGQDGLKRTGKDRVTMFQRQLRDAGEKSADDPRKESLIKTVCSPKFQEYEVFSLRLCSKEEISRESRPEISLFVLGCAHLLFLVARGARFSILGLCAHCCVYPDPDVCASLPQALPALFALRGATMTMLHAGSWPQREGHQAKTLASGRESFTGPDDHSAVNPCCIPV